MGGVGEHIDWLHSLNLVVGVKELQIACLGGRIATDIDDTLGVGIHYHLHYVGMHACTGRVGNDDIWLTMLCNKLVFENVLHVASIEKGVAYAIDLRVYLSILYGILNILYTNDLLSTTGYEISYGACTGVEVIDELGTRESGKVACHLI